MIGTAEATLSGRDLTVISGTTGRQATLSGRSFPTRVIHIPRREIYLIVRDLSGEPWLQRMLQEMAVILDLPANWNSYGAHEIDPRIVAFVLEHLLPSIMVPGNPFPAVVPTHKGGVMFEWHARGIDLEIEVISPGRLHVHYEDQRMGSSWEGELTSNLAALTEPLRELSARGDRTAVSGVDVEAPVHRR